MLRIDESKIPRRMREVLEKGQGKDETGRPKHQCCVALSMMRMHCCSGTWGNGSMRFLHCVCKMIDEGTPRIGTTFQSAIRAMKGWGVCDEDLWPSNVDLSCAEFEDWKRIPEEAWNDAKKKRIQVNKARSDNLAYAVLNLAGREFRLFTQYSNVKRTKEPEDEQLELLVIDSDFETVAWATLRAYVKENQIILEDLFVKPEFRRVHHGKRLLHRIEQTACLEEPFSRLNHEILVPISAPDAGPTRYNAVRSFFLANGYEWKDREPILRNPFEWSMFTAVKRLDCVALKKELS